MTAFIEGWKLRSVHWNPKAAALLVLGACAFALARGGGPTAGPQGAASQPVAASQPDEVVKYEPATPEQAETNRKRAADWAEQARAFAPTMHLVEADHYWIYSAWDRSNDALLKDVCEKMYKALCQQFGIPAGHNIWAGKCPIFIFWEPSHWQKFCSGVYKRGNAKAAGFCGSRGDGFVFVAIGPARSKEWFFEVLVHESTHAFLSRYVSNRMVPDWAHEGLAEYMAATLVNAPIAGQRYVLATKRAVQSGRDVSYVFRSVSMNDFDYGIAQSLVRFLILRNARGFGKFITGIKEGKDQEEAMKDAFNWTLQDLQLAWEQSVGYRR